MNEISPEEINIDDFNYPLPPEKIAEKPLEQRDSSKLLIFKGKEIRHSFYCRIAEELPADTTLFFNNTRVIPARIHFRKSSGALIEVFLLEPDNGDYSSLYQKNSVIWKCMVGGVKKWKNQETLILHMAVKGQDTDLKAELVLKTQGYCSIHFFWTNNLTFSEVIEVAGSIPLPPYIKRKSDEKDKERYQTVYAVHNGSVAAPTAGLHFNENLLKKLSVAGIEKTFLTLHVGAGTFKPVTAATIAQHAMHEEHFEVDIEAIKILADDSKKLIPVGTTSMRTLESLYWLALKLHLEKIAVTEDLYTLKQWEDKNLQGSATIQRSILFNLLLQNMDTNKVMKIRGRTGICIIPGYTFRVCEGLITNFHQPKSTLLLLIAAITGEKWKNIYETALENDYRFLSYGDGCLFTINKS
jgi:S-adenosylmethionine:tRNA ribosyltransferase-isomerase